MTQGQAAGIAAEESGPRAQIHAERRLISGPGLLIGFVFFAASLTPSLIPRSAMIQGVLGGALFAFGYAIGIAAIALLIWLGLPQFPRRAGDRASLLAAATGLILVLAALSQAAVWQDSIRRLMDLAPLETSHPLKVAAIAGITAGILLLLGWLVMLLFKLISRQLARFIPERVAIAIGLIAAFFLLSTAIDGVLVRSAMRVVDSSYAALDALIEQGTAPPDDPLKSGSAASLVQWDELGNAGRRFVDATPAVEALQGFWQGEVLQPLRVYVGLNAAETSEERATLALRELIRVGGFDRSILVVAVPTGTGFMEEAAIATLEYLHRGDVATVAMQYSYLQSPYSLLFEPGYGANSARALLRTVYDHWTTLPGNTRPKLYLQGLSLGALSSEQSVRLHEVLGDPFQGALWSGPPFPSPIHRSATEERVPGSPPWLPLFEDGSFIRFTNQTNALDIEGARWGPMRIVYLQYATDPIVFFRTSILWRRPAWLDAPRGPDVSPQIRWYPVVTALQLVADMVVSTNTPLGHGHQYAPDDYIDAWIAVTEPEVTPEDLERLKREFGA